jgi:hypothetical protein
LIQRRVRRVGVSVINEHLETGLCTTGLALSDGKESSVLVLLPSPSGLAPSRKGVDPIGDRTLLQLVQPLLHDRGVLKVFSDVSESCAALAADTGTSCVNCLDATLAGARTAHTHSSLLLHVLRSDTQAFAVSECTSLAQVEADASPLARLASNIATLCVVPSDWSTAGPAIPPLTSPPWYLDCKMCKSPGHFSFECPNH